MNSVFPAASSDQGFRNASSLAPAIAARALATPAKSLGGTPECTPLSAIEHVVIFINENRSFDSYFGTYSGVKGFSDGGALPLNDGSGKNIFYQPFPDAQTPS